MSTSKIPPPNRIFLILLCAVATFSPALSKTVHVNVADTDERPGPSGARILETLWAGNEIERREAAEEADELCDLLEAEDDEALAAEAVRAVRALRDILRLERDDWIASRILQNLYLCDSDRLDLIYLEALRDGSPNRRWRAIQWFTTSDHPDALPLLRGVR